MGLAVTYAQSMWSLDSYRDEWSEALQNGQVALHLLPSGCRSWYQAAAQLLPILNFLQDPGMYEQLADSVMQAQPEPGARSTYIEAAANLVITRSLRGQREPGHRMLQSLKRRFQVLPITKQSTWAVSSSQPQYMPTWFTATRGILCSTR